MTRKTQGRKIHPKICEKLKQMSVAEEVLTAGCSRWDRLLEKCQYFPRNAELAGGRDTAGCFVVPHVPAMAMVLQNPLQAQGGLSQGTSPRPLGRTLCSKGALFPKIKAREGEPGQAGGESCPCSVSQFLCHCSGVGMLQFGSELEGAFLFPTGSAQGWAGKGRFGS